MLSLLLSLALAGEGTIKANKFYDDGTVVFNLKTQKLPGGSAVTTMTAPDGTVTLMLNVIHYGGQAMITADFQSAGVHFGGTIADTDADALILTWWKAGVLTKDGPNMMELAVWTKANNITMIDTEAQRQQLIAYGQSHPAPSFSSPPPSSSASSSSSSSSSSAPRAPSTVSVQLHIGCKTKVRLFFGTSANGSGTYGWEEYNTVRSTTVKPGSVICIADDRDHVQTCWTAGTERADLEVSCSGISAR